MIRRRLIAATLLALRNGHTGCRWMPREGAAARGASQSGCSLPESNAEGLEILNNYYPGYWWDHTDLTVAVQAHPSATAEQLAAIADAIETWDTVLRDCFDGLITLTDVTGSKRQVADIVVHYVPTAGGVVFGGYAVWRAQVPEHPGASDCHRASTVTRTNRSTSGG